MDKGQAPEPLDDQEAERVAEAVETLGLRYVVLTSVARDDQSDHGATLFTRAMAAIRARNPLIAIEVLTPDFWGSHREEAEAITAQRQRLQTVLSAAPVCFNHNLETVERLQERSGVGPPTAAPSAFWQPPASWRHRSPPRAG